MAARRGERPALMGEHGLACLDPRALVSDGGQLAASHTVEEAAIWRGAELREVIAQKPCQPRMGWHYSAVALGATLELSTLALPAIIGPVATRVGRGSTQVQLAPLVIILCVLQFPVVLFGRLGRQDDVIRTQVDSFLRSEPGAIHQREEGDQPGPAWLLRSHRLQDCPRLLRVHDATPVHLAGDLWRGPLECPDGIAVEQQWQNWTARLPAPAGGSTPLR